MEETDINELEKCYWVLKAQSKSGRFDQETFKQLICPPVPDLICEGKSQMEIYKTKNGCYGYLDEFFIPSMGVKEKILNPFQKKIK